jgi:hypothetical protein
MMPGAPIQPKMIKIAAEPSKAASPVAVEQRSSSATFAN